MNAHDAGHGRGGLRAALGRITAPTPAAGVDSDRLRPLAQQREPAQVAALVRTLLTD